jgi:hypothetical protein
MKALISIVALTLAMAFAVPAFAGGGSTPQTKEECMKATGKVWDDAGKKCVDKQ